MSQKIYIIASCTDRKRVEADEERLLRSLPVEGDLEASADLWWSRVTGATSTVAASDLYAGSHWKTVLEMSSIAPDCEVETWVASAGLGLIASTDRVPSYGATFARSQPDSVSRLEAPSSEDRDVDKRWWGQLSRHRLDERENPRSVTTLALQCPNAVLLVAAGPNYVAAMSEDLCSARTQLCHPEQLLIVTSPSQFEASSLASNVIPSTADLQPVVGGALTSLHARVGAKILRERGSYDLNASSLQARYSHLALRSPKSSAPSRDALDDDEVRGFIRDALVANPRVARTTLLRELRASGRACEQKRFKGLFEQVIEGPHYA